MLADFEVICFDAGGTLLAPYPSVGEIYSRVAAQHGCCAEPEAIEKKFHEIWHRVDAISHLVSHSNEKIEKDWWRHLVREVFSSFESLRDFDAFFEELYELFARPECWRLFPESVEVLKALKSRGKKLCIISNWDSRLLRICEGMGIQEYFDFILISAVFGASKPSRKIFDEALRLSGVEPEKAVHIGDSFEDDIKGAGKAGIKAILIDRKRRSKAQPEAFDKTAIIHDLRELLTVSKP